MPSIHKHAEVDSKRQKIHYESIHNSYEVHYFDQTSMAYREQFFFKGLLDRVDLNDCDVADLASGSGYNSLILRNYFPTARLTGFDISEYACEAYERILNASALQADLTKELDIGLQFDALLVVGGLHHCVSNLDQTFTNCAALLRPGGYLIMVEPNNKFFLESVRQFWYRTDRYFDYLTEDALDHDNLIRKYSSLFRSVYVRYFGGPAYYFVLNSLVTRIPFSIKDTLAKVLWPLERLWNRLPHKALFPAFAALWERLPTGDH